MSLFVNELSLHGQFRTSYEFGVALNTVMSSKAETERRKRQIYCCDRLRRCSVTSTTTFMDEVNLLRNREQKISILRWFDESNWSHDQRHSSEEFFWLNDALVTERAIAEAGFLTANNEACAVLSFDPSDFSTTPLLVTWQIDEEEETRRIVSVPNVWLYENAVALLDHWDTEEINRPVQSWKQLIEWGRQFCPHLIFADYILDPLKGVPFSLPVASQAQKRLMVLNTIANRDANGGRTAKGQAAYNNHFLGDRAWFTDESDTNKTLFKKELTFPSPSDPTQPLFCPWHGKISTNYFRIHFHWPLNDPKEPLYVVYIGPKITKK